MKRKACKERERRHYKERVGKRKGEKKRRRERERESENKKEGERKWLKISAQVGVYLAWALLVTLRTQRS